MPGIAQAADQACGQGAPGRVRIGQAGDQGWIELLRPGRQGINAKPDGLLHIGGRSGRQVLQQRCDHTVWSAAQQQANGQQGLLGLRAKLLHDGFTAILGSAGNLRVGICRGLVQSGQGWPANGPQRSLRFLALLELIVAELADQARNGCRLRRRAWTDQGEQAAIVGLDVCLLEPILIAGKCRMDTNNEQSKSQHSQHERG